MADQYVLFPMTLSDLEKCDTMVIFFRVVYGYGYSRVYRPTGHSIGHFGDGGPEQ